MSIARKCRIIVLKFVNPCITLQFKKITNQMQQFSSLLSWRLFTAQHVSGVCPPIIRSSMTAVAASGFTFVSWWQSCCVRGRAGRPDHEHMSEWDTQWRSWLRHCATNRKVADPIPHGVTKLFHLHNFSGRTMALGLTQPLTEMSTRNVSWR